MNNSVYGMLVLHCKHKAVVPNLSVFEPEIVATTDSGFHSESYAAMMPQTYDSAGYYWHSINSVDEAKAYRVTIPNRQVQMASFVPTASFDASEVVKKYASMSNTDEDPGAKFGDLIRKQIYDTMPGAFFASMSHRSQHGFFLAMSRNVSMYFYGLYCQDFVSMVWTNEESFPETIKRTYGEKFLVYRFRAQKDNCAVLHSARLCTRVGRWRSQHFDHLKIFAALERQIFNLAI